MVKDINMRVMGTYLVFKIIALLGKSAWLKWGEVKGPSPEYTNIYWCWRRSRQ